MIRIDHFRGFADFWAIPSESNTAAVGTWLKGPGKQLFNSVLPNASQLPVIAEDLGFLSDDAVRLRQSLGFPGMKILQFAFNNPEENIFLPHFYDKNCVVYTGTHDNNTTRGWFELDATDEERKNVLAYLQCSDHDVVQQMIKLAWSSVANTVIVPLQDLLNLDSGSRMNIPGTTDGNWKWRLNSNYIEQLPISMLQTFNRIYSRMR